MVESKLTALQREFVIALSPMHPPWTLVGGAALGDAPRVDGGFSPPTLAWVLQDLQVVRLGKAAGIGMEKARKLDAFREELIEHLLRLSKPE